jgi:hypothetical protein
VAREQGGGGDGAPMLVPAGVGPELVPANAALELVPASVQEGGGLATVSARARRRGAALATISASGA